MMEGSKIASSNRRCSRECTVGMASLLWCLSLSTVIIGSLVSLHFARSRPGIIRPPYSFSSGICTSDEELTRRTSEVTSIKSITASSLCFVGSFDDPSKAGRGRYSPRMHPIVTLADRRYFPVFREHCRPPCYVDEHYLPTLVTKLFPGLNSNMSLTWVDWSRGGAHPATYRRRDVSVGLMERTRNGYSNNTTADSWRCEASQGLKSW
ncbi:uncharacterized protein LOC135597905 [Musa acuminata AAA Group]|uniref:uncharacterized protein LOC135597905 n=1 Tax=Musa acuminata AAA Group TaxID=214697 RepID=UPI0031D9721E